MGFRNFDDLKVSELRDFYANFEKFLDFEKFLSSLMDVLRLGTLAGQIYIYLFLNRVATYTTTQLAKNLGQDPSYVHRNLMRMNSRGYVKRVKGRRHFWMWTDNPQNMDK